jgi:hypothetical protein
MITLPPTLRTTLAVLNKFWGVQPVVIVACLGYEDEHIQIWHPEDYTSPSTAERAPTYVIPTDTTVLPHPDVNPTRLLPFDR